MQTYTYIFFSSVVAWGGPKSSHLHYQFLFVHHGLPPSQLYLCNTGRGVILTGTAIYFLWKKSHLLCWSPTGCHGIPERAASFKKAHRARESLNLFKLLCLQRKRTFKRCDWIWIPHLWCLQLYDSAENIEKKKVKLEFRNVQFNNGVYSRCKQPPLSPFLCTSIAADLAK